MSGDNLELEIGSVISTAYDADGFLTAQIDRFGGVSSPSTEVHSPYGFDSRPLDAITDGSGNVVAGCKALLAYEGDRNHVWLSHDTRPSTPTIPQLSLGESRIYSAFGGSVRCSADGSVAMKTTTCAVRCNANGTVSLGSVAGPQDGVTLATPLTSILNEIATTLQAVGVALLTPSVLGSPPDVTGQANVAIAALQSALPALLQAMKSLTTTST